MSILTRHSLDRPPRVLSTSSPRSFRHTLPKAPNLSSVSVYLRLDMVRIFLDIMVLKHFMAVF